MVTERQVDILNKIIQEYIDSAKPVSSQLLEKKHNFSICSSMLRIEMQKLTDEGFVFQLHTSSGRVPTDKGYRFFVDTLLEKGVSEFDEIFKIEEILKEEKKDILKWASRFTKFLAEASSNFAIFNLLERDFLFKEGWQGLLEEPEFEEKNFVSDFIKFLENFEKNIENLEINPPPFKRSIKSHPKNLILSGNSNAEHQGIQKRWGVNSKIKIFIGRENPFSKEKNFSIISSRFHLPKNGEGTVSLLGPKRMAYDKNIGLINSLMKLLEKL